jgi:hypothetical protein
LEGEALAGVEMLIPLRLTFIDELTGTGVDVIETEVREPPSTERDAAGDPITFCYTLASTGESLEPYGVEMYRTLGGRVLYRGEATEFSRTPAGGQAGFVRASPSRTLLAHVELSAPAAEGA